MKKFIAYFDYLGFKEFIENNDLDDQQRVMGFNFRDIESALCQGKYKDARNGIIADLSTSRIDCINFSDTVVFFTKDDSIELLVELLAVAYSFHWREIGYNFPVRGAIVYGELEHVNFSHQNDAGGTYNLNSVYGRGLVAAHTLANSLDWAGTVIDESITTELTERGVNVEDILNPYVKKYKVPYKTGSQMGEQFVLNLVQGTLNDEAFTNYSKSLEKNFAAYNKPIENPGVRRKLENTIAFLETYHEKYLKKESV